MPSGSLRRRAGALDVAVWFYLAVLLLSVVQVAVGGQPGRIAAASVPYLVALVVVAVVRSLGPDGPAGPQAHRWIVGLVVAGSLLAVWALVAFTVALPDHWGQPHGYYRLKVEVVTPLGAHNTAAGLLLVVVVAAAVLAARDLRWIAASALAAAGMIATLSRGAAAVLVVIALAAWAVRGDRRARWVLVATSAAVMVGVLSLSWVLDASPPPGAIDPAGPIGASVVGRSDLAVRGVEVGLGHVWIGAGLGSFEEHAVALPPPNDHAHQLFAHAFAEGGLVLLVVAAALVVLLAARGLRLPASPVRDVTLLGGAALVAHAQLEILGGRLGYELLVAYLLGLSGGTVLPRRTVPPTGAGASGSPA